MRFLTKIFASFALIGLNSVRNMVFVIFQSAVLVNFVAARFPVCMRLRLFPEKFFLPIYKTIKIQSLIPSRTDFSQGYSLPRDS